MQTIDRSLIRKVKTYDRLARWVITLAGVAVIGSVIAILLLIVSVTLPLFRAAKADAKSQIPLPREFSAKNVLALGVDYVELTRPAGNDSLTAYALTNDGNFSFFELLADNHDYKELGTEKALPPAESNAKTLASVERFACSMFSLLWSDGSISLLQVELTPQFDQTGRRTVKHEVHTLAELPPDGNTSPRKALARRSEDGTATFVKLLPDNKISITQQTSAENLLGEKENKTYRLTIEDGIPGPISAMTMDRTGKTLYVGTTNGCLARWELTDDGRIEYSEVVPAFRDDRAVTSLAMVFGDASLAVGDGTGQITAWFDPRRHGPQTSPHTHPFQARSSGRRHSSLDPRQIACKPRRRRIGEPGLHHERKTFAPPGRPGAAFQDRLRPARERACRPQRAKQPPRLENRLPASRNQPANAVRQSPLRGLRPARVQVANHRRRTEIQPGAHHFRHL